MCEKIETSECFTDDNHFKSIRTCRAACDSAYKIHPKPPIACLLPVRQATCSLSLSTHYFDPEELKCKPLPGPGCPLNANNFTSEHECRATCDDTFEVAPHPISLDCQWPLDHGRCEKHTEAERRFHYDLRDGRCREFEYYGCRGNKNAFKTLHDCIHNCSMVHNGQEEERKRICVEPPRTKATDRICGSEGIRYYFQPKIGRCVQQNYGSCYDTNNDFPTMEECRMACDPSYEAYPRTPIQCMLPPRLGSCTETFKSYFYDYKKRQCKTFTFSGCGGNSNQFVTKDDCRLSCGLSYKKRASPVLEQCSFPKAEGACFEYHRRFYHDSKDGRCKEFVYKGCNGNENNYLTLHECKTKCGYNKSGTLPDICKFPVVHKQCKFPKHMFTYDAKRKRCRAYVGCQEQGNVFKTKDDCVKICQSMDSPGRAAPDGRMG